MHEPPVVFSSLIFTFSSLKMTQCLNHDLQFCFNSYFKIYATIEKFPIVPCQHCHLCGLQVALDRKETAWSNVRFMEEGKDL